MMLISILILVGVLALAFKLTGWAFRICGKILGFIFSIIGYILIGVLGVSIIGTALIVIPLVLISAIIAVVGAVV